MTDFTDFQVRSVDSPTGAIDNAWYARSDLHEGAGLRAVDLYAGAGGLSLGLQRAGFHVTAAVEQDHWAALTYANNFRRTQLVVERVSNLSGDFFDQHLGADLVVGGPPCQGFSVTAGHRRAKNDERNQEVFHFVSAALRLKPKAIVLENVPAIAKYRTDSGELLIDRVQRILNDAGYDVKRFVLDAASYGVPQHRLRFFLVASVCSVPDLHKYETAGMASPNRAPVVTVSDAIDDLPVVRPGEVGEDECLTYEMDPVNEYQRSLRSPEGVFWNHVPMRHSARLVERFAAIPIGGNGATVWSEHPARRRGNLKDVGVRFDQNHRRMSAENPAPTITAYMYSTCLHPTQHRNLTVREAARLQSFPDSFRFWGKRTTLSAKLLARKGLSEDMGLNQLNQVGNAVPPILGTTIGTALAGVLCR